MTLSLSWLCNSTKILLILQELTILIHCSDITERDYVSSMWRLEMDYGEGVKDDIPK